MVRVVLLTDHETVFEATEFPFKMGRHPSCHVSIDSGMVSRFHAQIIRQGDEYFIEDLKAANKTFVNGQQVGDGEIYPTPLQDGDRLKLGPVKLRFENKSAVPSGLDATLAPDDNGLEVVDGASSTIMGSAAAITTPANAQASRVAVRRARSPRCCVRLAPQLLCAIVAMLKPA